MTERILVTGSNGLLGQKLTDLLIQQTAYELIATGTGPNRHPKKEGYTYLEMDISDAESVRTIFEKYKPAVVIHGAAMTMVDACESEKERCYSLNVEATKNIAMLCEKYKIFLVHVSTDFIFDGEKQEVYTEEDTANPLSFYGWTKWEGEKCVEDSGCAYAILRTVLVYGVVQDMSRSNIVLWAKGALQKGEQLRVVNDQWRCPTLAEDLAEGCLLAAKQKINGVFNISGKDCFRIDNLVREVAKFWGFNTALVSEVSSDTLKQPAKRPANTSMRIDKARTQLGYNPRSFIEGLKLVDEQLVNIQKLKS